jgi:hypothetical protein
VTIILILHISVRKSTVRRVRLREETRNDWVNRLHFSQDRTGFTSKEEQNCMSCMTRWWTKSSESKNPYIGNSTFVNAEKNAAARRSDPGTVVQERIFTSHSQSSIRSCPLSEPGVKSSEM